MYSSLYSCLVKSPRIAVVSKTNLICENFAAKSNFSSALFLDSRKLNKNKRKFKKECSFKNRYCLDNYLNTSRQYSQQKRSEHKGFSDNLCSHAEVIRNIHKQPIKNKRFVVRAHSRLTKKSASLDETDVKKKATYPTKQLRVSVPVLKNSQVFAKKSDEGTTTVFDFKVPIIKKKIKLNELFYKVKSLSENDLLEKEAESIAESCQELKEHLEEQEKIDKHVKKVTKLTALSKNSKDLVYRLDKYAEKKPGIVHNKTQPAIFDDAKTDRPFFHKLIKKKMSQNTGNQSANSKMITNETSSIKSFGQNELYHRLKKSTMHLNSGPKDYDMIHSTKDVDLKGNNEDDRASLYSDISGKYITPKIEPEENPECKLSKPMREDEKNNTTSNHSESVRRLESLMAQERIKQLKIENIKKKLTMINNDAQNMQMNGTKNHHVSDEQEYEENKENLAKSSQKVFKMPFSKRISRRKKVEITQELLDNIKGTSKSKYYIVNRNKPFSYLEPDPNYELYSKKYKNVPKYNDPNENTICMKKNSLDLTNKDTLSLKNDGGIQFSDNHDIKSLYDSKDTDLESNEDINSSPSAKSLTSKPRRQVRKMSSSSSNEGKNSDHHSTSSKDQPPTPNFTPETSFMEHHIDIKITTPLVTNNKEKITEDFVCVAKRTTNQSEAMPANQIPVIRDEGPKKKEERDKKEKEKKTGKADIRLPPASNNPAMKLNPKSTTIEPITILPTLASENITNETKTSPKNLNEMTHQEIHLNLANLCEHHLKEHQSTLNQPLNVEEDAERMKIDKENAEKLKSENQNSTPMSLSEVEDKFREHDLEVNRLVKKDEEVKNEIKSDENVGYNNNEILCDYHKKEESKEYIEGFLCSYHKNTNSVDLAPKSSYCLFHQEELNKSLEQNVDENKPKLCDFHAQEINNETTTENVEKTTSKNLDLKSQIENKKSTIPKSKKDFIKANIENIKQMQTKSQTNKEKNASHLKSSTQSQLNKDDVHKKVDETSTYLQGVLGGLQKTQSPVVETQVLPEVVVPLKKSLSAFNIVLESKHGDTNIEMPLVRVNVYNKEAEDYLNNILKIEAKVDFKDDLDNIMTVFENNEITVHPGLPQHKYFSKSPPNDFLKKCLSLPNMQIKIYQDTEITNSSNAETTTTIEFKKSNQNESLMDLQVVDKCLQKYVNNVKLVQARILLKDALKADAGAKNSGSLLNKFDFSINKGKSYSTTSTKLQDTASKNSLIRRKLSLKDLKKFCTKSNKSLCSKDTVKSEHSTSENQNEEQDQQNFESTKNVQEDEPDATTMNQVLKRIEQNLGNAAKEVMQEKFKKETKDCMRKILDDPLMKLSPQVKASPEKCYTKDMDAVEKIVNETKKYMRDQIKQKSANKNKKNCNVPLINEKTFQVETQCVSEKNDKESKASQPKNNNNNNNMSEHEDRPKSLDMLHFEQLKKDAEIREKSLQKTEAEKSESTKEISKIPITLYKNQKNNNQYDKYNYNIDNFAELLRLNQKEEEEALRLSKRRSKVYFGKSQDGKMQRKINEEKMYEESEDALNKEDIKVQNIENKIQVLENPSYVEDISSLENQEPEKLTDSTSLGSVSFHIDPNDRLDRKKLGHLKKSEPEKDGKAVLLPAASPAGIRGAQQESAGPVAGRGQRQADQEVALPGSGESAKGDAFFDGKNETAHVFDDDIVNRDAMNDDKFFEERSAIRLAEFKKRMHEIMSSKTTDNEKNKHPITKTTAKKTKNYRYKHPKLRYVILKDKNASDFANAALINITKNMEYLNPYFQVDRDGKVRYVYPKDQKNNDSKKEKKDYCAKIFLIPGENVKEKALKKPFTNTNNSDSSNIEEAKLNQNPPLTTQEIEKLQKTTIPYNFYPSKYRYNKRRNKLTRNKDLFNFDLNPNLPNPETINLIRKLEEKLQETITEKKKLHDKKFINIDMVKILEQIEKIKRKKDSKNDEEILPKM